jgi:hypothetical protein
MGVTALKLQPKFEKKMYQATVHVTRVEEWCVQANSEEEARELLASVRAIAWASEVASTLKWNASKTEPQRCVGQTPELASRSGAQTPGA